MLATFADHVVALMELMITNGTILRQSDREYNAVAYEHIRQNNDMIRFVYMRYCNINLNIFIHNESEITGL